MAHPLRILALDVAFVHTGLVVAEYRELHWTTIDSQCITTEKESERRHIYVTDDRIRRVSVIYDSLMAIVEKYRPQLLAAELPASGGKSAAAHCSMGMATAVVACLHRATRIPLRNYSWEDGKLAATGKRNASKQEVQLAIVKRFPELAGKYTSVRSATGFSGEFEHVADAAGSLLSALSSDVVEALVQQYKEVSYE